MATQDAIDQLRLNIGDPGTAPDYADAFYTDAQLSAYLDAYDGVEPRARVAALLPMLADAVNANDFTDIDYAEKASQRFAKLQDLLTEAKAEVAALDEQDAVTARGKARRPVRVAVQWEYD